MTTVRATLVATALLPLPIPLVAWVSVRAAAIGAGANIGLPFRIALTASNWYTRLFPIVSVIVLGGIVIFGLISARTNLEEKRSALLSWVCIAAAASAIDIGIWLLPFDFPASNTAVKLVILSALLGAIAVIAAVVVAAQVQGIVWRTFSTPVRGWHIAVGGTLLLFFGPFALLVPIWVLVTSRRTTGGGRPA